MNDNLKNLKFEPDKEVWQKVSKTIQHKIWMRRIGWTSAVVGIIGLVMVAAWPKKSVPESAPMVALTPAEPIAEVVEPTPSEVEIPQAETIVNESKTPSQVLTIKEQPIIVEKPEVEASSEIVVIDNDPETSLGIIGGADGPTAIFVANQPTQPAIEAPQIKTPVVDDPPIESPIVETPKTPQHKTSDPTAAKESIIWVPNIFSPNSDEEAVRTFRVKPNDMISDYQIRIYDRSGHMVYKSDDAYAAWDGSNDGMLLPQAAYVYVIKYRDRDGNPFVQKGTVTLVR